MSRALSFRTIDSRWFDFDKILRDIFPLDLVVAKVCLHLLERSQSLLHAQSLVATRSLCFFLFLGLLFHSHPSKGLDGPKNVSQILLVRLLVDFDAKMDRNESHCTSVLNQ